MKRKNFKIHIILLYILIASLFISICVLNQSYKVYEFKTIKLDDRNGFYHNVIEYYCYDNVETSYYFLENKLFVSTWRGDSTGKGARYGECIIKIEVQ